MTDHDLVRGAGTRLRTAALAFARVPLCVIGLILIPLQLYTYPLILVTVGVPLMLVFTALARRYLAVHRRWAGRVLEQVIEPPYRRPANRGPMTRVRTIATDPATWKDLAFLPVNAVVGVLAGVLPLALWLGGAIGVLTPLLWLLGADETEFSGISIDTPGGVVLAPLLGMAYLGLAWWGTSRIVRWHAMLVRFMLAPSATAALTDRVRELSDSRADTVDAQAAELRRIERDLHDGAQARLVALGMSLGMAEELLARDPDAARDLLVEARQSSSQALAELRDLVRGIHPPVLADRGLDGALRALALAHPLPVEVDLVLDGRPEAPVESAAYFAVAETLTNVAKHSGATSAWVRVRHENGRLALMIGDNGRGGAEATEDGGLRGIERRLGAFDGTLGIASPSGGPTIVTMELPCALSPAPASA
ncbi:signal transduction histidine kinase [Saccharothrix tamanrassetensis]|uniref:histidine kinase n=1 Tax=Saccharothrix tamanrassetensis TaxID=1051531 RepID=A0A841CJX2_9PSEU|nr:sensor domain-containing protein [Saccharothrix tamanrassetensis]MBB5956295.1 signal transduction histidine kinase [Saccharothrix tamanrassetensis]